LAVGICDWVEVLRDGLVDGLDFSVTVDGEGFGLGPGLLVVIVVRRSVVVADGVTFRPGVVTESELAFVVVVVLCVSPSM
jgi:hypothetical protein